MLGAMDPLHPRQGVSEDSFGLGVLALVPECRAQVHGDHKRVIIVCATRALVRCQEATEERFSLGVLTLAHVGASQQILRTETVAVPGWLAPVPLPQGFRQAKCHRARVPLLAGRAHIPALMESQPLVLGGLDPACHVCAPRFCPASACALDGQRRAVVVQADAAVHGLFARLLVASPLPVLALALRATVERLLAAAALLPVPVAGGGAGKLLPARRARHCASHPVIRCSEFYHCSRKHFGGASSCGSTRIFWRCGICGMARQT